MGLKTHDSGGPPGQAGPEMKPTARPALLTGLGLGLGSGQAQSGPRAPGFLEIPICTSLHPTPNSHVFGSLFEGRR